MRHWYASVAAVLLAVLVTLGGGACAAEAPMRVAILPVTQGGPARDQAVDAVVTQQLTRRFQLPFADIVPIYQLLPQQEVASALPATYATAKPERQLLAQVAAKAQADLVIAPGITSFVDYTYNTRWGDLKQKTALTIRLCAFNARTGQYAAVSASRLYEGDWSVLGDADTLARAIMDELWDRPQIQAVVE